MTFADLDLVPPLLEALDLLGYQTPTPVQEKAIPAVLAGGDLMAAAQTGTGKTASFTLPMITLLGRGRARARMPRSLVLCPTRELAAQVAENFDTYAKHTRLTKALLIGGVSFGEQDKLIDRGVDVLIATPGRLMEHLNAGSLKLNGVEVLVLDEADRMLDLGFAEDIERITHECANRQQTLLFSATGGGKVLREMIAKVLREPLHLKLNSVDQLSATTVQQIITADDATHKERLVQWLLSNEPHRKAMIFCNTRAQVDRLYGHLVALDYKAFVLHGEKDQKDRKLAIDRFRQGGSKVLVATDVAARGLDIDDLDLVINFDMPRSGDEYVHRVGRTGRAGGEGLAVSLICHNDWNLMSSIERYLKQRFERRVIKELKGSYQGPKNVKASGKAVGVKKKKTDKKDGAKKSATKTAPKRRANAPKAAPLVSQDGMAPLKRKKPAAE